MALNAIVRTNMTSLNAHRKLSGAGIQQKSAAEKLSSGRRINSAADDAAGLGISEKMRAQIFSIDRASLNAQDGMSLVQTAEGALSSISDALIRIRELVIQAANDTNVHDPSAPQQSDRISIQDEIDQLLFEINNIAYRTEFNTRTLLDGSNDPEVGILNGGHVWVDKVQTNRPAEIQTLDQFLRFQANPPFEGSFSELLSTIGADLQGMTADQWIAIHASSNFGGLEEALNVAMGVDPAIAGDDAQVLITGNGGRWEQLEAKAGLTFSSARDLLNSFIQGLHNPNSLREEYTRWNEPQRPILPDPALGEDHWDAFIRLGNPEMGAATFARSMSTAGGQPIYDALRNAVPQFHNLTPDSTFSEVRSLFYQLAGGPSGAGWGSGLSGTPGIDEALRGWLHTRYGDRFGDLVANTGTPLPSQLAWGHFVQEYLIADTEMVQHQIWRPNEAERERGVALWLQIGANSGQGMTVGIRAMNTRTLGQPAGDLMDMIDVENPSGRPISDQVNYLDAALNHVNRQRSELGAVHNRLEFAQKGLDVYSESLTAAMSRIRDADMAKEMMNFYQANVMTQAATAMMSHANTSPQMVLELLQ